MADPVLEVEGLSRRYGERVAVHDLSFVVGRAEAVGLLGVNGAGKTTTLRLLAGYLSPHAGTARLCGYDLGREPREVRRRVGYLAEGAPLPAEMRVEPFLRFRAGIKGLAKKTPAEVERVLGRCALSDERRTVIGQLSRGYRQRVGLADALLGNPPLLLLDEPTTGLDPQQVRELRSLLREVSAESTVILSSHVLGEVEALCRRVLVIDRGRLVADGEPGALRPEESRGRMTLLVRGPKSAIEARLRSVEALSIAEIRDLGTDLHRVRLVVSAGDPRAEVARLLCEAPLALLELREEVPTLEEDFVGLVGGRP